MEPEEIGLIGLDVVFSGLSLVAMYKCVMVVRKGRARRRNREEMIMMEEGVGANDGGEGVEEGAAADDGVGNSNEVNIEDEVNRDIITLVYADEDAIKALVSRLPRKLTNPQNTCLSQSETEPKIDSSAVDTLRAVIEAILLNKGGLKFSESENLNARELIVEVKRQLSWILENRYKLESE